MVGATIIINHCRGKAWDRSEKLDSKRLGWMDFAWTTSSIRWFGVHGSRIGLNSGGHGWKDCLVCVHRAIRTPSSHLERCACGVRSHCICDPLGVEGYCLVLRASRLSLGCVGCRSRHDLGTRARGICWSRVQDRTVRCGAHCDFGISPLILAF